MNRTWILLRAQIFNFFPINEIREPGNKKKNTAVIIGFGAITVILFLCIYNVFISQALVWAGEAELIPAYMVSLSGFILLFLSMFCSSGILFGSRDMDMLASLPVKNSEIIGSKFLFLYLLNIPISLVIMVPGGIIWMAAVRTDFFRFLFFLVSAFFVPLIPMCLASAAGVFIVFISSYFKNRNFISLFLSFTALGLIGAVTAYGMQTGQDISSIGAMLAGQITGLYPLSGFFLNGSNTIAGIGLFLVLSAAVCFLFLKIAASRYACLNALAVTVSKFRNHRFSPKKHTPFMALCQKEFGRFFSSYMAVLNTGFGVILLCVFSVFLLILPPGQIEEYTGIGDVYGLLANYAPIVVASMLSLSCPAASSVSLEGKNIWILQSAPVSMKTVFNSKIAVNLSLHLIGYALAVFATLTRLDMTFLQTVSLICIPVCYSVFTAVLGAFLNKKYPSFDWDSEVMVVKQSFPVIVVTTVSMVIAAAPIFLSRFLPLFPVLWITAGILLALSGILYRKICRSTYI